MRTPVPFRRRPGTTEQANVTFWSAGNSNLNPDVNAKFFVVFN
jgi:hypothetical protein